MVIVAMEIGDSERPSVMIIPDEASKRTTRLLSVLVNQI
jgi:hypothetical protein